MINVLYLGNNWRRNSRCRAWLHESQSNSQYNRKDYEEHIEGRLTLATPTNCKEDSQEHTQTSQQHLKVDVHFIVHRDFIFITDYFGNLKLNSTFFRIFLKSCF